MTSLISRYLGLLYLVLFLGKLCRSGGSSIIIIKKKGGGRGGEEMIVDAQYLCGYMIICKRKKAGIIWRGLVVIGA